MSARARRALLVAFAVVASASVGGVASAGPASETGAPTAVESTASASAPSPQTAKPSASAANAGAVQQENESVCSFDHPSWRAPQLLAGVRIQAEQACRPDDPNVVAASVLGTNNVPDEVLKRSGLSRDAVVKGNDTDGDGDPDVIHITLEVMGINEHNAALNREIAPGVSPAFWVFAPKTRGMVTDGSTAARLVRMPSPPIRVEEGDRVKITVENTHYAPHTLHLHGVTHEYEVNGSGNDGVPQTSEDPILPGEERTYEFTPERPGTNFYHCHVAPSVHVKMGLSGMLVVTENRSDNRVQTFNVGGGKVRHPSEAMTEKHDAVYDLQYQGVDEELHEIPKRYDDTREIAEATNREYDATNASMDYFLLNGRSFPYTLRESVVAVEPNASYRLRVLNAGSRTLSLHTHGHKFSVEALDGVSVPEGTERTRDVVGLTAAQRADIVLNTTTDGRNSFGEGVWLMHDHREPAVTTDGIGPGGTVTTIAYDSYLRSNGIPEMNANLSRYFDPAYYDGEVPAWGHLDADLYGDSPEDAASANASDADQPVSRVGGDSGVPDLVLLVGSILGGALLVGAGVALGRWAE
ncbi:multicopper oxidase domain-containing protein [Halobacterium litoreum]|uniref:Multicopper oxidase domain-containing protein n=1 Tax=Halobacterium litoreum TaxID=2039234 RepID=A0ABD5NHN9_9EURY|nr:multicopper oxidase domain-containing protein [Halobacterium litoreum]UHH12429.1 multicopper oxidase domain-containing protein [Halobacterium litoreum]